MDETSSGTATILGRPPARSGEGARAGALRVSGRLLAIAGRVLLFSGRLAVRSLANRIGRRRRAPGALLGEELCTLCETLGPTFTKLGQILSTRPDLLPPDVVRPLARLQDDVAPFDGARLPGILEETFGRPTGEVFSDLDLEPVASASIAQVHRARLPDGRDVAVKVRRPGVVERVTGDLALVSGLARALARLPGMDVVPLVELARELGDPIRQQLDFVREARSLRRFRSNFRHVEHVTMPVLVEELCTDRVLVMEYLDGLERVTSTRFSDTERRTAALAGLRALYKMIFLDGFIHADMHPGNVFLREWGELVVLDMGLVAELSDDDLQNFVDFFFGLVNNRGEVCARIVWDTALHRTPRADRAAFTAAICELVAAHARLKSHEFEVTRFVYDLIETQRRHGIRGSTQFIMTVLSMVVYDGICKQLYPECDFQREARGYLITAKYRHNRVTATV